MADAQRPKENARGWLLPLLAKLRWPLVLQIRQAELGSSCIFCNYIIRMNARAKVAGVHLNQTGKQVILFWYFTQGAPDHPTLKATLRSRLTRTCALPCRRWSPHRWSPTLMATSFILRSCP